MKELQDLCKYPLKDTIATRNAIATINGDVCNNVTLRDQWRKMSLNERKRIGVVLLRDVKVSNVNMWCFLIAHSHTFFL